MAAATYGLVLLAVFAKPLVSLMIYAAGSEVHSHIILIPFIVGYLLSIKRPFLPAAGRSSFGWAALFAAAGLTLWLTYFFVLGEARSENDQFSIVSLSLIGFLVAGGFAFLGSRWMRAAAFPIAFLLFMVPLPDGVVAALETASKYASAEAAALLFPVFGVPTYREGLIFSLPGIAIEVAQECSGIRSSWVLLITSLLAAHLFLRSNWRRTVLVALVIPLGILRNGFRIAVIGWLCVHYGPEMIHSVIHKRGGPLFFTLALIPLFGLLWLLRRGEANAPTGRIRQAPDERL
ncbi:MAG: exosortase [Verrucomicrobiota bacterium]|nr:exosortase [Verrucomicrobiota bacterium]